MWISLRFEKRQMSLRGTQIPGAQKWVIHLVKNKTGVVVAKFSGSSTMALVKEIPRMVQCHDDHYQPPEDIDRFNTIRSSFQRLNCAYKNIGGGGSYLFHRWFCFSC